MIPSLEALLLFGAIFLIASVLVSRFAGLVGVPILLVFLALGMLAGSDGPGGIYFDNPQLAQAVGVVALANILFSGGLDTQWPHIRRVLLPGISLATLGVTLTALLVGLFVHYAFGFTWVEGVLLGAIISSTDAAAVFAVLRGRDVHLRGRLAPMLEMESGSNDPMAAFLTVGMVAIATGASASPLALLPGFLLQMGLGTLAGIAAGRGMAWLINRIRLDHAGLYPVLTVAAVMLIYGATTLAGGNGFLAVYVAGIMLGRMEIVHKRSLVSFHDGIAWLMQIVMFATLGLQVFPSRLDDVAVRGVLLALFLILVARPVSVFVSLLASRFRLREKVFISWVGLRGAAPIVLATFPLVAGLSRADENFHLVFFVVLASVLLQGTLIVPVARWLRVYNDRPVRGISPMAYVLEDGRIADNLTELTVAEGSFAAGRQLLDLRLPQGALIVLVGRGDELLVPDGSTQLRVQDRVLLMVGRQRAEPVAAIFEAPARAEGA